MIIMKIEDRSMGAGYWKCLNLGLKIHAEYWWGVTCEWYLQQINSVVLHMTDLLPWIFTDDLKYVEIFSYVMMTQVC
jgi:hypothetical protein